MTAMNIAHTHEPSRPDSNRTVLLAGLGAIAGLLLGIVVTAGIVVWGMSQIVDQGGTVTLPPVIELQRAANGNVVAHSGNGIVILPLAGLLLGAVTGAVSGRSTRRS